MDTCFVSLRNFSLRVVEFSHILQEGTSDFIRNLTSYFPKQLCHFTPHKQNSRVLLAPHLQQHLLFLDLLLAVSLSGGSLWFLMALSCCFSVSPEMEHLFTCRAVLHVTSWAKCLCKEFCPLKKMSLGTSRIVRGSYIFRFCEISPLK